MVEILSTGIAVLAGAAAVWTIVRLINRRHDRNSGKLGRWLLHNAASAMKRPAMRPITGRRRLVYGMGLALTSVGLVLILSVFATLVAGFGTLGRYDGPGRSVVFRAFGGLILTIFGRFILYVAVHGLAGFRFVSKAELARIDAEQRQATILPTAVHTTGHVTWDVAAVARFENHRK